MRAIQMTEFGGPEVLRLAELPVPEPGEGEVLIEVARAGINFADTHTRVNSYVRKATLPLVPGAEVAGRIVGVSASQVSAQAPPSPSQASAAAAQASASHAPPSAPQASAAIRSSLREGERVVALVGEGGYAQYATAKAEHVWPIPDGVDDGTALALLVQGTTAWHLYRTAGKVAKGESVVVHSAAGGVGSLAVQLGHPLGAGRVIATASSPEKRELALELGADVAIDSAPEGLTERLMKANSLTTVDPGANARSGSDVPEPEAEPGREGRQVDVVFDMAGGEVFDASYAALGPFGRIVVCGIASREQNEVRTGSLLKHSRAVVGFYLFHCLERPGMFEQALEDLFGRNAREELRVVVGETYALGDAVQAHTDLRERRTTGKLLLDPSA